MSSTRAWREHNYPVACGVCHLAMRSTGARQAANYPAASGRISVATWEHCGVVRMGILRLGTLFVVAPIGTVEALVEQEFSRTSEPRQEQYVRRLVTRDLFLSALGKSSTLPICVNDRATWADLRSGNRCSSLRTDLLFVACSACVPVYTLSLCTACMSEPARFI